MIDPRHDDLLKAIDRDVIDGRVRSTPDGLEFDWHSPDGRVTTQKRLDDGDPKYLWPKGARMPVGVPKGMEVRVANPYPPLLIIEGTKQHLAAASVALTQPDMDLHVAVTGISGCWGWLQDDAPLKDFADIPIAGRKVIVVFDADVSSNRNVYEAAEKFGEFLDIECGAKEVLYGKLPGKSDGLDDILGRTRDPLVTFQRVIDTASLGLGRKPAKASPPRSPWFDEFGRFMADDCAAHVLSTNHLAVTRESSIAVYSAGWYHNGESREFQAIVLGELGNDYRKSYYDTVFDICLTRLKMDGRVIPTRPDRLLVNVRNGLLDPVTMILHPHDPEFLVLFQFGVEWDADAVCPVYERWIESVLPGRALEIEDAVCPMLDPTITPSKAVFLYGPTRSGKSTFGRLMKSMVGMEAVSAVSLHQMSDDRFAAANLFGKVLNIAMDLSAQEVQNLSLLKLITGDDAVQANRKYGNQFAFENQALVIFSANEVPPVSEVSGAYLARMSPFKFPTSFEGAEDPTIEASMMTELPGIFRRMVLALHARLGRGGYALSYHADIEEFRLSSNRVAMFLRQCTTADKDGTDRSRVYVAYKRWVEDNGGRALGKQRFFSSLRTEKVREFKPKGGSWRFGVKLIDPEKDGEEAAGAAVSTHPPHVAITSTKNQVSQPYRPGVSESAVTAVPLAFDLETCSADELFHRRPGFIRIAKSSDLIDGVDHIHSALAADRPIAAHNGFGFDFPALGLDIAGLAERGLLIDTMVLGLLDHPPLGRRKAEQVLREYSASSQAAHYELPGKTGDIKKIAKKHGGFDKIPLDDQEYNDYCQADAAIVSGVLGAVPMTDYAWREMRIMGRLAGSITGTGFRVDTTLLGRRMAEGGVRRRSSLDRLLKLGLPTDAKAPQATRAGKEAIVKAFAALGVTVPLTDKGNPSLSQDTLGKMQMTGEAADLQATVLGLNGIRTIYQTISNHLVGDRVHPTVHPLQASGRFSIREPGLTVMGKKKGKYVERDVYIADEGCSLIAFDLDQIDPRAVAVHSQDSDYLKLFLPGMDSHGEIAEILWGDRSRREEAKAIAHGWNYGEGIRKLVINTELPEETIREFDRGMRERFPRLVEWRNEVYELGRAGVLLDNGFGRQLKVDPDFAYTQAPAYMGQSTARDLMCEGVLRLPLEVSRMIRAFVHDEIVLSVPDDRIAEVSAAVRDSLTFRWAPPGAELDVEITTSASKASKTWGGCYAK